MMSLAGLKSVLPEHQIPARPQGPGQFATAFVDILAQHLRQLAALTLALALIAVLELVQILAMLRIEERQWRATIR